MKKHTVLLAAVLAIMLFFMAWFLLGSTLRTSSTILTTSAAEHPDVYESIENIIVSGAAPQLFSSEPLEGAEQYTLSDVTIHLKNGGLFPAEWLEIEVEPDAGDVAVYSMTGQGSDIPARGAGDINLKLISRAEDSATRQYVIEYYVFGWKKRVVVK